MATSLKSKIKNPVVLSLLTILLSMLVAIGVGQSPFIRQQAEKTYFGSETFINTLADLTGYLKQTVVEDKELYYPEYEALNNLLYSIETEQGNKIFANYDLYTDADIKEVEQNSKFYMKVAFKTATSYSIQSSNEDLGFTNKCFRRKFDSSINKGLKHLDVKKLGYNDLKFYYVVKNENITPTDFIYNNVEKQRMLIIITIFIIIQVVLTFILMSYIILSSFREKLKGKMWEVLNHICIEAKVIGLILIYIVVNRVYWHIQWANITLDKLSIMTKFGLGSLYIIGSIVVTLIMTWYLVDIVYIWKNGRWQRIKQTSLIYKHRSKIKEVAVYTFGVLYSVIGINIEKPSYIKIALFNLIHIVALVALAVVTWRDMDEGMLLAVIYTLVGCLCGVMLTWDYNNMLRQIRKIKDKAQMIRSYIKMLLSVFGYGVVLILLAVIGYESDVLGLCMALVIGVLVAALNVYYVKRYRELYHYVGEIKALKQPIKPAKSFLSPIIEELASLNESFQNAVSQEVISQRMKTELISNVSHDLKTPLTSIISYIDLLKNEDLSKETQQEYIRILEQKSERLKILIEDLFEASKAASGNLEITKEKIDLVALIKQTLGESAEKIEKSTLQFKLNMPDNKVMCELDGRRTYRIFENLIGNILKYSAPHSRVYIDCIVDEEVSVIFKNMSAYEMNFTADEITERFKRGDKSRHTEGSGLGLAIAKNLAELQGGTLEIVIDGDLFKVIVKFSCCSLE